MKEYLISLLVASLVLATIGILAPPGARGGLAKHIRLIAALVWICILVAPLSGIISDIRDWWSNDSLSFEEVPSDGYREPMQQVVDEASKIYFCDMLTQTLEERFSLSQGTVRCLVAWKQEEDGIKPEKVTLILSGSAVWHSPKEMEVFVTELIGCICVSAIE